ncbi:MAG: DUF6291 domain-containing protein, partial [Clostridiales bacterium]|nr:DUF6291 domain-containing protein [Clostridiales bacterium]
VKVTFAFVRTTLDRDNEKYQARCAANARNGQKGGRPRKEAGKAENPPETDGFAEPAEEAEGAAALPPEPDVFFEEPERPAAFAEYPPEPTDAAEGSPLAPQAGDRAFYAAVRGRSQKPPACSAQTYGAPPPNAAREREDAVERARRNAIRKLQREAFDAYAPPRASPAGGW